MWNSRPKSSLLDTQSGSTGRSSAGGPAPAILQGRSIDMEPRNVYDGGLGALAVADSSRRTADKYGYGHAFPLASHGDAASAAATSQARSSSIDESLDFLNRYVNRGPPPSVATGHDVAPAPWGRTASPSGGLVSTPGAHSRLAQAPRATTPLEQWMASREEKLGLQPAGGSVRGPSADRQPVPQFPPPGSSVPVGALHEPAPTLPNLQRRMSPQTIVQQSVVAQQMSVASSLVQQSPAPPQANPPPQSLVAPAATTVSHTVDEAAQRAAANGGTAMDEGKARPVFRAGDHDGNLILLATYLKNHYGREAEEAAKGIETMDPADVLGLAQCFYIDLYRLVRTLRETSSAGRGAFLSKDPSIKGIQPIIDLDAPSAAVASSSSPPPPPPPAATTDHHALRHGTVPEAVSRGNEQALAPAHSLEDGRSVRVAQKDSAAQQPPSLVAAAPAFPPPQFPPFQPPPQSVAYAPAGAFEAPHAAPQSRAPFPADAAQPVVVSRAAYHPRGPSAHRRELSLEQQLRDVPRRVSVPNWPLRTGMPILRAGVMVLKYCRSGPPHLRYFSVQDKAIFIDGQETLVPHLVWAASINGSTSGYLCLVHLQEVLIGPVGPNAQRFVKNTYGVVVDHLKKPVDENLCATLVFKDRTLELCFMSEEDYLTWIGTLQSVVLKNQEMEAKQGRGTAALVASSQVR